MPSGFRAAFFCNCFFVLGYNDNPPEPTPVMAAALVKRALSSHLLKPDQPKHSMSGIRWAYGILSNRPEGLPPLASILSIAIIPVISCLG